MKKQKSKSLRIGQCVQTFLGEVCRWTKGYRLTSPVLDGKLISDEDGEALAGGTSLGLDDLEEVEDPEAVEDEPESESEGAEKDEDLHNGD